MTMRMWGLLWALLACALASLAPPPARADDAFFEGKTLTYRVGAKTGGGYDTYARLVARHLPKHLPVARVLVHNVPGAGSARCLNQLWKTPADGLTIATFNTGMMYAQIAGLDGVRFDLTRLSWIGKAGGEPRVFIVGAQTPFTDAAALRNAQEPVLLATTGIGSTSYTEASLIAEILPFPAKLVTGYSGAEKQLAMQRGEMHGYFGSFSSLRGFIESGGARILFHVAGTDELDPSVPSLGDVARGPNPGPVIDVLTANAELGRMTAGPPDMPAERLATLRRAYAATLADPELLAEAAKLRLPILPMGGEELTRRVRDAMELEPSMVQRITQLIASGA